MWPQSLTPIHGNVPVMAFAAHMQGLLVIDALSHTHGVRGSLDGACFPLTITAACTPHKPLGTTARHWECASP